MTRSTESRYFNAAAFTDHEGRRLLEEVEPWRYEALDDNIRHVVVTGDHLWGIAQKYYGEFFRRASGLWWAIAWFQPQPIVDPTLTLAPGTVIIAPSPAYVLTHLAVKQELYL